MRTQFQNLTRAALAAAWMLMPALAHAQMGGTGDPIDGARALLGHTPAVEPARMFATYDASAVDAGFPGGERALLARFDWPSDRPGSSVQSIAERVGSTAERALLGR
ncbi:MAG: hypothetical protein ACREOC_05185 [Gemmatimonadales bacterium]